VEVAHDDFTSDIYTDIVAGNGEEGSTMKAAGQPEPIPGAIIDLQRRAQREGRSPTELVNEALAEAELRFGRRRTPGQVADLAGKAA